MSHRFVRIVININQESLELPFMKVVQARTIGEFSGWD
jgi:hypothetical protein